MSSGKVGASKGAHTGRRIWSVLWVAGIVVVVSTVAVNLGHATLIWSAVQDCGDAVGIVALAFLAHYYVRQRRSHIR
jgi:hypothetical protein